MFITPKPIFGQGYKKGVEKPNHTPDLPITIRVPSKGRDPWFSIHRSKWYELEASGAISFLRLRAKGKRRGVTLIETAAVLRMLEEARAQQ